MESTYIEQDVPLRDEVYKVAYGTPEHQAIVAALKQRIRMSKDKMSDVIDRYTKDEEAFRVYVNATENDKTRETLKAQGKPQYTTIHVPYTLAILWASHTYWTSVFLGRNPIWQFSARHGEPHKHIMAVEAMLDYQVYRGEHLIPYYVWLMDVGKYGRGIVGTYWAEEYGVRTQVVTEQPKIAGLLPIVGATPRKKKVTDKFLKYKGNRVYNVRPQDWINDPRVPTHRFQDGEFCGRHVEVGWNTIIKRRGLGLYYNTKALYDRMRAGTSSDRDKGSSQLELPEPMDTLYYGQEAKSSTGKTAGFVELTELVVELCPADWKLGKSREPEKYVFTLANDDVILSIHPLGEMHDKFPFAVLEYEMEGYSLNKRSMFEIGEPLNDTLSWLFNSHMYNVRKVMNDTLFVDPSRYVMKDMTNPNAGKLVRVKPEYYGTDVKLGVHQLQVVDVTRAHLQDAQIVADMLMRLLGVNNSLMGQLDPGGRKTAQEIRTSSSTALSRQKTICEWYSALGFQPLADMMLMSTQQHYEGEMQFKIAGDLLGKEGPMMVSPDMIAGMYDFVPVDGSQPIDRFAMANLWKELLTGAGTIPGVVGRYDLAGMFGWIAQLSGIKNLSQFEVKVGDPADILAQQAAGNIVPIGAEGDGTRNATGQARDFTQVPKASAGAGVGRTA